MSKLTTSERARIFEIERHWHEYGTLPKNLSPQELTSEAFRLALENRGIDIGSELNEEQIAAIISLTNFDDRRARNTKLAEMGISLAKWSGWKRNPTFKAYLESLSNDALRSSVNVAHEGLIKAMDRGQVEAVKYYMEHTGRAEAPRVQNLQVALARLVESIQIHVRDPEVLTKIAADFDRIMTAPPAQQRPALPVGESISLSGSL